MINDILVLYWASITKQATDIAVIIEDIQVDRIKRGRDKNDRPFKSLKTNTIEQKLSIISGKSRSILAKKYRSSTSPNKAKQANDKIRLTGKLIDGIDCTLTSVTQAPQSDGSATLSYTLSLANDLTKQGDNLVKLGFDFFGLNEFTPQEFKRIEVKL